MRNRPGFGLLTLDAADPPAIAAPRKRHESSGLQLAGREDIRTVFTTGRRDLSIVRLERNRTLGLIPDLP